MATYSNPKDTLLEEILCIKFTEISEITGLWHLLISREEKGSQKKKSFFKIKTTDSMHLQIISFSMNIAVFSYFFPGNSNRTSGDFKNKINVFRETGYLEMLPLNKSQFLCCTQDSSLTDRYTQPWLQRDFHCSTSRVFYISTLHGQLNKVIKLEVIWSTQVRWIRVRNNTKKRSHDS